MWEARQTRDFRPTAGLRDSGMSVSTLGEPRSSVDARLSTMLLPHPTLEDAPNLGYLRKADPGSSQEPYLPHTHTHTLP